MADFLNQINIKWGTAILLNFDSLKCDMCDKAFTQSAHLTINKHTHTGVKPFKCDLCDKEITQSGNLPKFNNIKKSYRINAI